MAEEHDEAGRISAPVQEPTIRESFHLTSICMLVLLILALLFAVTVAKPVLLPIILALLLNFIFRPIHRFLHRLHIPKILGAIIILAGVAALTVLAVLRLAAPAAEWFEELPGNLRRMQTELRELIEPVKKVTEVAQQVDELAKLDGPAPSPTVELEAPPVSDAVWTYVQDFLGYLIVTFILLFFMLVYGQRFYRRLAQDTETAGVVDEIADSVSRYMLTITVINACLGACIGFAMYLLHMPNPLLWGVMATILNYIPYLGALAGLAIVTFAAVLVFDSVSQVVVVPIVYFVLTALEGNFITPMILGRRFTINPIIIFVWLLLWGWMWGIPGALLAVPLLMGFRIFCAHFRPLNRVGDILGM